MPLLQDRKPVESVTRGVIPFLFSAFLSLVLSVFGLKVSQYDVSSTEISDRPESLVARLDRSTNPILFTRNINQNHHSPCHIGRISFRIIVQRPIQYPVPFSNLTASETNVIHSSSTFSPSLLMFPGSICRDTLTHSIISLSLVLTPSHRLIDLSLSVRVGSCVL